LVEDLTKPPQTFELSSEKYALYELELKTHDRFPMIFQNLKIQNPSKIKNILYFLG